VPLIQVKVIEGVFTAPQKRQIVERLTDTMVEIDGENLRQVTWRMVEEVGSGEVGDEPWAAVEMRSGRTVAEPVPAERRCRSDRPDGRPGTRMISMVRVGAFPGVFAPRGRSRAA
jgi:4-oxalocrotonate tautomerase